MIKFLLINHANHLFGRCFNLRADILIRANTSAHVLWDITGNADITKSRIRHSLDQSGIEVTWHKDMKIGSAEWEGNSEDVKKHSLEPKEDGRYEIANKKEREKMIILEISKFYYRLVINKLRHSYFHIKPLIIPRKEVSTLSLRPRVDTTFLRMIWGSIWK